MNKIERQLGEYFEWCEKVRGMTEATLRAKRNVLARFVRVTEVQGVEEITDEVMRRWVLYETERGAAATSVNVYNSVVVALVRYYREMGVEVPVNLGLVARVKGATRAERKFYTAEEVSCVVAAAMAAGDEVSALQITMMFETGMRIAELVRLRMGDFGGRDGRRVRFMGKGRKLREVYVTAATGEWVREYVARWGVTDYLWCVSEVGVGGSSGSGCVGGSRGGFVSLNGEPPTVNTVRLRLRRAFARAGFDGFYPHALRHSFATDLQRHGASVAEIKEMIGHANIATTERYLHGLEGKMRELWERYR